MEKAPNNAGWPLSAQAGILTAFLLWSLHYLPLVIPEARLWGLNHLRFLPPLFLYIYLVGGIVSLALLFPPLRDIGVRLFQAVAESMFEQRFRIRWVIIAALGLVAFWFFRLPIFVLGDSYSIVENIGNDLPVIFKWSEIGSIYLAYFVAELLPVTGSRLGQYAYGVISVLSGAVTVYIFCALAYELGKDAAGRLFIFCLSVFAGWMVLFFGYTENYPVLWPFVTGYIYFGVRYINKRSPLLWPTLMVVAALILHLQTLFFLASYLVLLVSRGMTARIYKKYKIPVLTAAGAAIVVFVIVFVRTYLDSLEFRMYIIPLLEGHPTWPGYTLFSIPHILDMLSQLLLAMPLLPALIIIGRRGWKTLQKNKIDLFLLLFSFGGIVFLAVIDPKLGMGRDWDLFAMSGLAPMLLFAKNIVEDEKRSPFIIPAMALLALTMAMPFMAVNLKRQPAIDNYKYLLHLDLPKSRTGITILRAIAYADNDSLAVDSLKEVLIASFPAVHLAPQALELAEQGRYQEAMLLVDSMALYEPNSVEVFNMRGLVNLKQGRYAKAIQDLEMSARLGRYDARPLVSLASAYNRLGQVDLMMDALRRGQRRNPKAPEVIDGLMTGFHALHQFDSAMIYAARYMEMKPTAPNGYWVAGFAAMQMGDRVKAKIYLTRCVELSTDENMKQNAIEYLRQLE